VTRHFRPIIAATLFAVSACSPPAPAPLTEGSWTLDQASSNLSFVSVKAGDIGEAHGFGGLSGTVAPDGAAILTIDLASVDTGIDIRDERMREFLFETTTYPRATVTAAIDPASFATLGVGESRATTISATLDLHGAKGEIDADVTVLRAGPDTVVVSSNRPIIVDAGAAGLADGLAKLQELAGLASISAVVPVTFSLTYRR